MNGIFLLLGSNIGDRLDHLRQACQSLSNRGVRVLQSSSIYETAPWGKTDQQWFLNVAIEVASDLSPHDLLEVCQAIEKHLGRSRVEKWGERTIDIDILYYNNQVLASDVLEVPHPGIPGRRFTLKPLAEIAPNFAHPGLGKTQKQLLDTVDDPLEVVRTDHLLAL